MITDRILRPSLATPVAPIALFLAWTALPASAQDERDLVTAIPGDVFMVTANYPNAERAFLDEYWADVWSTFERSGVMDELMALAMSNAKSEEQEQAAYFQERATDMWKSVDWSAFSGSEVVFAERLMAPIQVGGAGAVTGAPDMVMLARMGAEKSSEMSDGLSSILNGILGEVGAMSGMQMATEKVEVAGTEFTVLNLLQGAPDAGRLDVSIGAHDDVLVLTFGQSMRDDVAKLLASDGGASVATSARFAEAMRTLPAAEDGFEFFDIGAFSGSIESLAMGILDSVSGGGAQGGGDTILNARGNDQANALNRQGAAAARGGDLAEAIRLTEEAHGIDAGDSIVMYNLACYHAQAGNSDKSIEWLGRAVAGGFHAPGKIAEDGDLDAIRSDPRFEEIHARALELTSTASSDSEEVALAKQLLGDVIGAFDVFEYSAGSRHTDGYSTFSDSITVLSPDAENHPFYRVINSPPVGSFAEFLPKETTAFDVNGGVNLDALYGYIEGVLRKTGSFGENLLQQWEGMQSQFGIDVRKDIFGLLGGGFVSANIGAKDWVWMLGVNDEEKARAYLASGLQMAPAMMAEASKQNPMMGMFQLNTSETPGLEGFYDLSMGMGGKMVAGVAQGWFVVASSADTVRLARATAAGEHPNVLQNEALEGRAILPEGPVLSVNFKDTSGTGSELAGLLRAVSMFGPMSVSQIPDADARKSITKLFTLGAKLAPVAERIDFYDSSASSTTFDGKMWRTHSVTHYAKPITSSDPN